MVVEDNRMVVETEEEERVVEATKFIVVQEQDVEVIDWGLECNEDDEIIDDDVDSDYDKQLVIEESESEQHLDDCDFSDDGEEVIEARQKIRERRMRLTWNMGSVRSNLYANNCKEKDFQFQLGMKFADRIKVKEAVIMWNVLNGYNIKWTRSNLDRVQAECVQGCPWRLYASKESTEPTFVIRVLINKHTCVRAKKNRQVTSGWLANQMLDVIKRNPNITADQLIKDAHLMFGVEIIKGMCYRTKHLALKKIRGSYKMDYNKLRSYIAHLKGTDKEGRFELMTKLNKKNECIFQRLYIGFSALKKGFLMGCRKLIGFDGCFLKTVLGGVLLAAVGKDCNNHMYPIAWAVVEKETTKSWTWFCEILFSEFGLIDGFGWSFMSDKQKGLINAIQVLAPNAEHRHCARHVYANWKKKFGGPKFKSLFWACVKASTFAKYEESLNQIKCESSQAFEEFCSRLPSSFCKPLLCSFTKSDSTDNNICETFNSFILEARDKPIVHMLEDIRQSLMVRMHDIVKKLEVCKDEICPNIRKRLNKIDSLTRFCEILPAVGGKYEVKHLNVTYSVDLGAGLCSCVDWNLTGIPCVHAIACINHSRVHVENFVDPFYFKTTSQVAYKFCLEPLLGESEWPKINECPIQPPYICKLPGRPKKNRKRADDELRMHSSNKITKHGVKMKCSMCGGVGHNKRSCSIAKSAAIGSQVPEQPCNASTSTLRKHKRQARAGFGAFVAESGNVLWRNPSGGRTQLVVTSRHPNDCVQVGELTRGQQTRVEEASQANGSQVLNNPTPHS